MGGARRPSALAAPSLRVENLLQEVQVWRYFVQIADGIRHMHEARIMHRDIKPANIFLASNGSVLLGDLGLGRAFSSQTYEALSKVGTPLMMSPEVLDGRGYEWKSDVWSLGCLLYELATLRSPFKAEGDNRDTLFKKISVGKFDVPSHYSPQLHKLTASMIQIDPKGAARHPYDGQVCAKGTGDASPRAATTATSARRAPCATAATAAMGRGSSRAADDRRTGGRRRSSSRAAAEEEAAARAMVPPPPQPRSPTASW